MNCEKCGNTLRVGASFCDNCGAPAARAAVRRIELRCESCHGILTADPGTEVLECPYCGSRTLLAATENVQIERIRQKTELEKLRLRERQAEEQEEEEQADAFRDGILGRVLTAAVPVCVFLACACFWVERYTQGGLLLAAAAVFALAWCLGLQIIRNNNRYLHRLLALLGAVLVIPAAVLALFPGGDGVDWDLIYLREHLPVPPGNRMEVWSNDDESLSVIIYGVTESDFYEYIGECRMEYGYVVDAYQSSSMFYGYDREGYEINVMLDEEMIGSSLWITLDVPIPFGDYELPDYAAAEGLPRPESDLGYCSYDLGDSFVLYVGGMPRGSYLKYVDACIDAGFDRDMSEYDDYYTAENADGWSLTVEYEGNDTVYISFYMSLEDPDAMESKTE